MDKKALKNVAAKLRKAADIKLRKDLKSYPERNGDDADMRTMFREDCRDAHRVARLLEWNMPVAAVEHMRDMDTAARDAVGNMLEKNSKRFYKKYVDEGYAY
ncbi:hypothetical protein LCGC14_1527940 [marine sediment metagenome]|uniref:Uncharacterized protein n=1 Tax=marine sediment metagenome TaxID=412755 RepID=A0A0F9IX43_9ZZZZ